MADTSCVATKSSFGAQAISTRRNEPVIKFCKSKRPAPENTSVSPGPVHSTTPDSFAHQVTSRYATAPASGITGRIPSSDPSSEHKQRLQPGPGSYETAYKTVGNPLAVSRQRSAPAVKIGKGGRWSEFKPGVRTGEPWEPMLTLPRPPAGYLGDAPAWRMAGRRPLHPGGFFTAPSCTASPGPGAYDTVDASCFGEQVDARHTTCPSPKLAKSQRDASLKQCVRREDEAVLLCRTSVVGPNMAATSSIGAQVESKRGNPKGLRFGTADRFSDIKVLPQRRLSSTLRSVRAGTVGPDTPGPGSYVV